MRIQEHGPRLGEVAEEDRGHTLSGQIKNGSVAMSARGIFRTIRHPPEGTPP